MDYATALPGHSSNVARPDRMGDITLKQVRSFLAASACSTFRQAAQQVFLSQPTFCRVIQELESAVGEELFIRSSQGIKLSSAGEVFLPNAKRLMACYSATVAGMTKWRSAGRSQFMLAGTSTIMPLLAPALLSRLQQNFELPTLQFEDGTSQQVMASVLQGRADCGVCTVLGDPADQPDLHCTPLLQAPLGLLAHPDFALPASICSLADLNGINLARYSDESVISQLLQVHATVFDAYYASRVVYSNMPAAYALVQGGQVAAITSGVAATHPQAQGLRFVPLPGLLPILSVSLISKRDALFDDQRALMKELTRVCVLGVRWHASVARCAAIA